MRLGLNMKRVLGGGGQKGIQGVGRRGGGARTTKKGGRDRGRDAGRGFERRGGRRRGKAAGGGMKTGGDR